MSEPIEMSPLETDIIFTGGGGGAVDSVNGKTGNVVLTAADVGAASATALSAETSARTQADSAINASIETEINSRQTADTAMSANIAAVAADVDEIDSKIPAQASASNQLADKSFVNSSVQTATANFRGNWGTWAQVPTDASLYPADYAGSTTPTTNDYLVVQDASGYPSETLEGTWRFKYSGDWATNNRNGWHPEYQVNETPMTSDQLAALNSGITSALVTQISENQSDIIALNANKVDKETGKGLSSNDFTNTDKTNLTDLMSDVAQLTDDKLGVANLLAGENISFERAGSGSGQTVTINAASGGDVFSGIVNGFDTIQNPIETVLGSRNIWEINAGKYLISRYDALSSLRYAPSVSLQSTMPESSGAGTSASNMVYTLTVGETVDIYRQDSAGSTRDLIMQDARPFQVVGKSEQYLTGAASMQRVGSVVITGFAAASGATTYSPAGVFTARPIDNLTTTATRAALSANQGKVLKDLIDALTARVAALEGGNS